MKVLVTGAAGYIGAHVVKALVEHGHQAFSLDRTIFHSPNGDAVRRMSTEFWEHDIAGVDFLTRQVMPDILSDHRFDAIVHLAALISVEESTRDQSRYLRNNMFSTLRVLDGIQARPKGFVAPHLIFASTGTAFCPTNPYAWSKVACEDEIRRTPLSGGHTIFRFFNVSGLTPGLNHTGAPTHLIRRAAMVALGHLPELTINGIDWETRDGTCVRDYIHVEDVAASIVNAVVQGPARTPFECLGTGMGASVLEVVNAMQHVTGKALKINVVGRRDGDVASMVCPSQYKHIRLSKTLEDSCLSAYINAINAR